MVKKKKIQKLAGLWLVGEVVNHVGLYGSKVAEGCSVFQRRSCYRIAFSYNVSTRFGLSNMAFLSRKWCLTQLLSLAGNGLCFFHPSVNLTLIAPLVIMLSKILTEKQLSFNNTFEVFIYILVAILCSIPGVLTHYGLVMWYGIEDLCQHCFR